jgi:hypothetical protein
MSNLETLEKYGRCMLWGLKTAAKERFKRGYHSYSVRSAVLGDRPKPYSKRKTRG